MSEFVSDKISKHIVWLYICLCVLLCVWLGILLYVLNLKVLFPNVSVSSCLDICQINSPDKHMIGQIFKQMVWQIFLSILLMIYWTVCPIMFRLNIWIFLTVWKNMCLIMCFICGLCIYLWATSEIHSWTYCKTSICLIVCLTVGMALYLTMYAGRHMVGRTLRHMDYVVYE